jgi:hypothetical protein
MDAVKTILSSLAFLFFLPFVLAACEENWLVKRTIVNNTEIVEKTYCDFGCSTLTNSCKMNDFTSLIFSVLITAVTFFLIQILEYPFNLYLNVFAIAIYIIVAASDIFGSISRLVIIASTLALIVQTFIILLKRGEM